MTALRPERESGADWYGTGGHDASREPYASAPYDPRGSAARYASPGTPPGYASPGTPPGYASPGTPPGYAYPGPAPGPAGPHPGASAPPPADEETMALRLPEPPSDAPSATATTSATPGGRAARRRAVMAPHGRHGGAAGGTHRGPADEDAGSSRPLSRVEARRRARARRPSAGVLISRVVGEVFITTGVVMLLFVTYQLWWTNVRAHAEAGNEAHQLQNDWASGKRSPGVFEPGQGFAILHIPALDVVVPIAEGTSKSKVLDKGMVGHYGRGDLNTAMPDAKTGNFGLAGHRNTHGEPFRYINRLKPGDAIVVETQDTYFVYKMTSTLPVTSPANTSVLDPIPKGSGFTRPGRYITLTTCTPEFTSTYRLIVWGRMVEERPRSKGKPDALVS